MMVPFEELFAKISRFIFYSYTHLCGKRITDCGDTKTLPETGRVVLIIQQPSSKPTEILLNLFRLVIKDIIIRNQVFCPIITYVYCTRSKHRISCCNFYPGNFFIWKINA